MHHLANLVRLNGNNLEASLADVEESILAWVQDFVELLPASWATPANSYNINERTVRDLMHHQFEHQDHLDEEPTVVHGSPRDVLAGIHDHCCITGEAATELIYEDMPPDSTNHRGRMRHLELDERIVRIIDIAREVMVIGHSALTGIGVHAMAQAERTTNAELPAEDALANAARTLAYAGALARAAAKMIDFRIWPLDED